MPQIQSQDSNVGWADDCMDAGGNATQDAYMDIGGSVMPDAYMDVSGRVAPGAKTEKLPSGCRGTKPNISAPYQWIVGVHSSPQPTELNDSALSQFLWKILRPNALLNLDHGDLPQKIPARHQVTRSEIRRNDL